MKLRYFDVERFGVWNNARLDGLENGLTVIYGPNGSGKTTLMQFVRAVLYGRPAVGSARFLPSVHAGSQGGRIGVTQQDREYVVNRFWETDHGHDEATITRPDGTIHDTVAFRQLLGEVDEDVFNYLFTVGYREAEDFELIVREALADTGSTGLATEEVVRVDQAIAKVDQFADRLADLERERVRLRQEISRLIAMQADPPEELVRVRRRIAEIESTIRELQSRIAELEAEIARCESAPSSVQADGINSAGERIKRLEKQIASWRNWQREIEEQLAAVRHQLHHAALRDCDPVERFPQAQMFNARSNITVVENQLAEIQERLSGLRGDTSGTRESVQADLSDLRARVFQLCDQLGHHEVLDEIVSLEAESVQLQRCQTEIDTQLSLMLQRRRLLLHEYSGGANRSYLRHSHREQATCQSHAHDEWLETPVRTVPKVNHKLEALIEDRDRLLAELDAAREELSSLTQRRIELERHLNDAEVARQLEELRFDLNVVDAEIAREQEEKDVRTTTRVLLSDLKAEYEAKRRPLVLAEASEFLQRLTSEPLELVENSDGRSIGVSSPTAVSKPLNALSRGERDQVALSLRLALARAYTRRGTRLPLILDDVFITSDSETAEATAILLRDFAADNQQILFFTCHEHIAQMFRNLGVAVRNLPQSHRPVVVPPQRQPKPIVNKIVAEPRPVLPPPPKESLVVKAFRSEQDELKELPVRNTVGFEPTENWIFYTELTTPVDELTGISEDQISELATSGVHTVEDLLALIPENAANQLAQLGLSPSQLRDWQSQALLSCRVPMLRRQDAELLVLCGITTPEQLADSHPDDIYDRVSVYLQTEAGSRFVRHSNPFDRQTSINWVRWAAHARNLWHSRERSARASLPYEAPATVLSDSDRNGNGSGNGSSNRTGSKARETTRTTRSRRSNGDSDSRSSRSRRSTSSRSSSSRRSSSRSSNSRTTSEKAPKQLRFYLQRDAEVEDAPSIGPKTAEHLAKVSIITVRDLLNADADAAAESLGHKRIKGDTIREWQSQAALVCCVPELRGHDSQILVACEVTTAEELASFRPADLFARVAPFVDTAEGERIVRNGKKPDLEEITFWIDCAKKARTLQAA